MESESSLPVPVHKRKFSEVLEEQKDSSMQREHDGEEDEDDERPLKRERCESV